MPAVNSRRCCATCRAGADLIGDDVSMDTGRVDDVAGLDGPSRSTGWVARQLGIAPATLRTWHRRYRVGPTGRTAGGHRRYLPEDLDRLTRMRRLMLAGAPTAEAARVSADPGSAPSPGPHPVPRRREPTAAPGRESRRVRRLTEAAMALDQAVVEPLLSAALRRYGVVPTWTEMIVPVLDVIGERHAARGGCIAVEHLFTGCVRTALSTVVTRRRRWDGCPPVLLACLDQEQHSLALHALAAALAEVGCPCRVLGASVPADELVSAAVRIAPRAVFVWSQAPATARPADLRDLPPRRPSVPVVVGGPGWRDVVDLCSVVRVDSLAGAVAALSRQTVAAAC